MSTTTKVYFDTEFTGLHKNTSLISIGLVSECGKTFYAENVSLDEKQIENDKWLKENVISKLKYIGVESLAKLRFLSDARPTIIYEPDFLKEASIYGSKFQIRECLTQWLKQFEKVEMISDCLAYDWVLFCDIFEHAFNIPNNVYYIPFDLSTAFKLKGIDPDISREEFAEYKSDIQKHNALYDAHIIKACWEKVTKNEFR